MARVCVDCGTPKPPVVKGIERLRDFCGPCNKDTLTRSGEARALLCQACVHFKTKADTGKLFAAMDYNPPSYRNAACHYYSDPSMLERVEQKIGVAYARYDHQCLEYKKHHRAADNPSPNPLTEQQIEQYHAFNDSPSAFWLNPDLWQNLDVENQSFWVKPEESSKTSILAAGIAGMGALASALLIKKKFDAKP